MKIPLLYIPKTRFKKYLIIEKRFKCAKEIIPIGCDCHPAYTLQKLHIRKHSLPFDWLDTDAIKGISFVSSNIKTHFSGFLKGLVKNKKGHIVSNEYPYAEFVHEKNLIENKLDIEKFGRRIDRLEKLMHTDCFYLYNVKSSSLESKAQVTEFYRSVVEFQTLMKGEQLLCIYIRYDENLNENKNNCEMLLELLGNTKNVNSANYIREKSKAGIWGNAKKYPMLYRSLGIRIRNSLIPKMYIK